MLNDEFAVEAHKANRYVASQKLSPSSKKHSTQIEATQLSPSTNESLLKTHQLVTKKLDIPSAPDSNADLSDEEKLDIMLLANTMALELNNKNSFVPIPGNLIPPSTPLGGPEGPLSTTEVYDLMLLLLICYINYRQQNKLGRKVERELQMMHKMQEVKNLKDQGKWLLGTSVMAGVMGIAAGAIPIVGRVQGDRIQGLIGMFSSRLGTMKQAKLFDSLSQMLQSGSKTNEAYGHVMQVKGEGNRKDLEGKHDMERTLAEEFSAEMREELESWNGFLRFLQMLSEMDERTASNLYH